MIIAIILAVYALIAYYYADRYSKSDIDPDWAMFNLAGFTGSIYGRDFVDCKSPLVHGLYWLIAKVVGKDVRRVKLAYHLIVSAFGSAYILASQDVAGGFAYLVLVNSGWLYAFHGNVGAVAAGCFLLVLSGPSPWAAASLALAATLYEPKLIITFALLVGLKGWSVQAGAFSAIGIGVIACLYILRRDWFYWLMEANITIPSRMTKARKGLYPWVSQYTANVFLYLMPWTIAAVWARPHLLYWLPPLAYFLLTGMGRVIRPNHLIPLVPWIAASGIQPEWVLALAATDWVSSGLYLGNIWFRFYPGLAQRVVEAKMIGQWLKDKPGTLWVNSLHSEVYIYAQKPVRYGLAEQVEIREVAEERREAMREAWGRRPADWVVMGPDPGVNFSGAGYAEVRRSDMFRIFQKR